MENRTISVKNMPKYIGYFFLLFSLFEVPYLTQNFSAISKYYMILQVTSLAIILLITIMRGKFSKIMSYILLYCLILLFSTYANGISIFSTLFFVIKTLGVCLLFDFGISKDKEIFIKSFKIFISILVLLNLFTILIYPNGMYINDTGYRANWILGYKNSHIIYILSYILIHYIDYQMNNKKHKIGLIISIFVALLSTNLVDNSTGLVGLGILCLYILFPIIVSNTKLFNIRNYALAYIGLFIFVVILRMQNLFKYLIVDILGRDITFTGRIYIWDKVIELIKLKPYFGYGNITYRYSEFIFTTHNIMLDILYKGGIFLLISYFAIAICLIKEIMKYRKTYYAKSISIILFILFIMSITEAYSIYNYIYIFIIGYNIKHLVGDTNE